MLRGPCFVRPIKGSVRAMNETRRAGIQAMRKFLKAEGVRKRDIRTFMRVRQEDGTVAVVAVLWDKRTCAIAWKP